MNRLTRREAIKEVGLLAGVSAGIPLLGTAEEPSFSRLKIMVVGAHPDDPETGCGGTICRYTAEGHEAVVVYITRGEGGIADKTPDEAATIRTSEACNACLVMKARPVFFGQIDGHTEINTACYDRFLQLIDEEQPDICFTHWPIDTHRDHRVTSMLTYDAWLCKGKAFSLYYYEVMTGAQSQNYLPTDYIDITPTESLKREACRAHISQGAGDFDSFYHYHDQMNRFRGMESGYTFAEAFIKQSQSGVHGML